jgi:hypothetical protein
MPWFDPVQIPDATETTAGRVQIATLAQLNAGTDKGSTGVTLVVPCKYYSVSASGSLASLSDVKLTSPTDTQILVYVAGDSKWENVSGKGQAITYPNTYPRPVISAAPYTGPTQNASAFSARFYSIQVTGIGGIPTSWEVVVEAGLDNGAFTTVLTHTEATGSGVTLTTGSSYFPANFFRLRCTNLILGVGTGATGIDVIIIGAN